MTGVLDLSLPGTAAIASCVCGWLLTHGYATWVGLLAGLACGIVVGLVNGFITLRGFNPIIVTIGTLSVLTGLAAVVAGGYTFPGLTQLEFMGTHRYFGSVRRARPLPASRRRSSSWPWCSSSARSS
jgi:ribose transport system permease protein